MRLGVVARCLVLGGRDEETRFVPGTGPSKVEVDSPELRDLKAKAGTEDCVPGPGRGRLPAVTLPGGDPMDTDEFAKIPGLPAMYFIDGGGEIAHTELGGLDSEAEITDLVREHLGVQL